MGNRGMRASRNLRPTERLGRPETEESPPRPSLGGSVRGRGGDRRAILGGTAGTPAHGSLSPETQSQLRKGRERGSRPGGPPPAARRPPSRSGQRCGGPGRSTRAGQGGAGGGTWGRSTLQRPARGDLTRDPCPRQAGTTRKRPAPDRRAPGPLSSLPRPSPHPELQDVQAPVDPSSDLGSRDPRAPRPLTLRPWSRPYRNGTGPWEWVHLSLTPSLPGTRDRPQTVQAHLGRTGLGPDLAGPGRAAFSLSSALAL